MSAKQSIDAARRQFRCPACAAVHVAHLESGKWWAFCPQRLVFQVRFPTPK